MKCHCFAELERDWHIPDAAVPKQFSDQLVGTVQ
jgi:hypothetical protein